VDQYHGVPPYYETQAYIARIIRDYNRQKIAENPALGHKPKVAAKRAAPSQNSPRKAAAKQPAHGKAQAQIANTARPASGTPVQQQASR
jgi:hypothetical protein